MYVLKFAKSKNLIGVGKILGKQTPFMLIKEWFAMMFG
jgi:hypothetical protein